MLFMVLDGHPRGSRQRPTAAAEASVVTLVGGRDGASADACYSQHDGPATPTRKRCPESVYSRYTTAKMAHHTASRKCQ